MSKSDNWYQMDNVAKVFLATHNKRDTRSLRVSATLSEYIKPGLLQKALLETVRTRPQFQLRIRRGLFWHYMEETDMLPHIVEETGRICPELYQAGNGSKLHYQVSYYKDRINLDMFHAITDGTGALEFLNILVNNYLKLAHPGEFDEIMIKSGASRSALNQNSFKQFYGKKSQKAGPLKKAFHPGGLKLPYNQMQFFEVHMPVKTLIKEAKKYGVSLTSYLGTCMMYALHEEMPSIKEKQPVTISMPVNLRNYYPSKTSRNFFNSVYCTHTFEEEDTFESIVKQYEADLRANLTPERVKAQMDAYQDLEQFLLIRVVPLMIKMPVVKHFSRQQDKTVSAVISNLGVFNPPEETRKYIRGYSSFCSSNNIFTTVQSYNGELVMGIASTYSNTDVIKNFIRGFTDQGMDVTLYATEVTR